MDVNKIPYSASSCELPIIVVNKTSCIAGFCAILRQIIKDTVAEAPGHYCRKLLGFKDSCLTACSESSVWTKFCEVDLIVSVKFLRTDDASMQSELPVSMARFERHMSQPVRLHNLFKYTMSKKFFDENVVSRDGTPEHTYAEGSYMTLADIIIFVCIHILLTVFPYGTTMKLLPLTATWSLNIETELDLEPFAAELSLDWSTVPFDATPEGGSLPPARLKRKHEQLQNMCKPVVELAKTGDIIVDFCSGSGHLGILVAHFLPHCTVILLENKEESLNRAKERVKRLKLTNIKFYQCNLDYFKGHFDIGMSLHACGVATDLVIQQCIKRKAIFVCCPCCYGSLHDCHHLTYPRSNVFRSEIDQERYINLSHAADQTHDEKNAKTRQGYECMAIIDTDRKLQAEQYGYKVYLSRFVPKTCTPKNHILVGIPEK
ncbi:unnamed protein product [Xylocopa violacea]|uniref:Methyltransferase domain-containing protein n=1 Tax=Xylocopa violacea TaxID=135666 RepID=A0ABP1N7S2_XYLVO